MTATTLLERLSNHLDRQAGYIERQRPYSPVRTTEWEIFLWLLVSVGFYYFSMYLLSMYVNGDQVHYRAFYGQLQGVSFGDARDLQNFYLGSSEPLFALIMWLAANAGFDKDVFVSVLNATMIFCLLAALRRWHVPYPMILLCLSNYYVLVLMTGAERLKISYILMFAATAAAGRWKWALLAVAPTAHFQTLINYISAAAGLVSTSQPIRQLLKQLPLWRLILASPFVLVAVYYFFSILGDGISDKAASYSERGSSGLIDLAQGIAITALGFVVTRRKIRILAMMMPLLAMVLILGGTRLNMIVVVMFFYALMTDQRAGSLFVYAPMAYLSYKSIDFMNNVLLFGNGFN